MKNIIPSRLKILRSSYGYSQDYIAQKLGVVRQTYSHYENGRRIPDGNILLNLADLYEISIGDLMLFLSGGETPVEQITFGSNHLPGFYSIAEQLRRPDSLNLKEQELLYYFNHVSPKYRWELMEFAKILAQKKE